MIDSAAILFQRGGIVTGLDYNQIMGTAYKFGFSATYVMGFVTNTGEFVGGDRALKIAKEAGQVPEDHTELKPEDLFRDGSFNSAIN